MKIRLKLACFSEHRFGGDFGRLLDAFWQAWKAEILLFWSMAATIGDLMGGGVNKWPNQGRLLLSGGGMRALIRENLSGPTPTTRVLLIDFLLDMRF